MVSIRTECYCKQSEEFFFGKKICLRKLHGVELETSIIVAFRVHSVVHSIEKEQQYSRGCHIVFHENSYLFRFTNC